MAHRYTEMRILCTHAENTALNLRIVSALLTNGARV